MKQYTVEITDEALADMEQLYNHIAYVLLTPENAMGQYDRITDEILKLDVSQSVFGLWIQNQNIQRGFEECWWIIIQCSML